jgi:hypothetical protein
MGTSMPRSVDGVRAKRISQSVAIFHNVWSDIRDRTDEVSRARVCHAIADAILHRVLSGARDPADIYAYAVDKARSALN